MTEPITINLLFQLGGIIATIWGGYKILMEKGIVQIVYSADLAVVGGYSEKISHPQVETETEGEA